MLQMKIENTHEENIGTQKLTQKRTHDDKVVNISRIHTKKLNFRKKFTTKTMMLICIVVIAIGGILFSPLFAIKSIQITEMVRYTKSELCEMIGLQEGMNIIAFNHFSAKKILEDDQYIDTAEISVSLPDTINIEIAERKVRGYVPYMGSYLYIDEYGCVLDVQPYFKEALPVVKGLDFNKFQLGKTLTVKNQDSFDVIVKIAQMMTKYNLLDIVVEVDVSDPHNIIAFVNKVEVTLGDITDCDVKIRTMAECIEHIPEGDRGTLDLSDMSKPIVFKYLT